MSDLHDVDILLPPKYEPSGETQDIVTAIRSGSWLHIANIWVYRVEPSLQILFQQRDLDSPFSPGMLDCSAAGYLHAGETGALGGLREMNEELGIVAEESELTSLGRHMNAGLDHRQRERKWIINAYCLNWPHELSELVMGENEVPACFWISVDDLLSIERGGSITVKGLSFDGEELERSVTKDDFVYNVDYYHFRTAERIRNLATRND